MASMKEIMLKAEEVMRQEAVIVTAVEYKNRIAERIQVYFWDEREAAMDIISKDDLVQGFPEAGLYAFQPDAKTPLKTVRMFEGEEDMYFRIDDTEEPGDDFGSLPTVKFMEAVEAICALKEKTRI